MIQKIKRIGNFGVFNSFDWGAEVLDKNGNALSFKKVNIIYGRNYSGKTTLSRILRGIETGKLSDKFESPSFSVSFDDNTEITQDSLLNHDKKVRVFNEDFVRDNLRFINNPDDDIEPFAIIGDNNNKIEMEITALETELGSKEEGKETGQYALYVHLSKEYEEAKEAFTEKQRELDSLLKNKATNRETGIKYKADRFGDQNYDTRKLQGDIDVVLSPEHHVLTKEQLSQYEKLIVEKPLPSIAQIHVPKLQLQQLLTQAEFLITKKIGSSDKIEELAKEAILNRWVRDGLNYHKGKRDKCAFCGNSISEKRWEALERHFDEESDKLEKDIDLLISRIEKEQVLANTSLTINKSDFYSKFHSQIDELIKIKQKSLDRYNSYLNQLNDLLKERKNDILNPQKNILDNFKNLKEILDGFNDVCVKYEEICIESNAYTAFLAKEQQDAKHALRLIEVLNFISEINYKQKKLSISNAEDKSQTIKQKKDELEAIIRKKESQIIIKKQELNDEEKGAKKVNEYLNTFFGHQFLALAAQKKEDFTNETKRVRFEVVRDGKKAYHLSEGECRLIAFCYFLAKLDDTNTHGVKPIIWIDDPISSLDGNHIFFVYSLLRAKIVETEQYEQLFISTHNLNFLKYLKRLIPQKKEKEYLHYFIVVRHDKESTINTMPDYLKEYVTEFNYLFHQIYKCANIEAINDSNYTTFYNFANDARKFLEIYLYYKYPDNSGHMEKLTRFFGENKVPAVLADRINNEYSHMSGVFERGAVPIEVPEMKKAAQQILDVLKKDDGQYNSLLKSINIKGDGEK